MNKSDFSLLKQVLSQPTAPFREKYVIELVCQIFDSKQVPYFIDSIGNIVVGVKSRQQYLQRIRKQSKSPLRVFIAHMDHPGFHGSQWITDNQLKVKWHGGSPKKHLNGAKVWVALPDDQILSGTLSQTTIHKHGHSMDTAIVKLDKEQLRKIPTSTKRPAALFPAKQLFGGFDFKAPMWTSGKRIYARVADDLAGVFCITSMALKLLTGKKGTHDTDFIGLLTRAEEVGFVGAIGHFELGLLQKARRPVACVSLEASRTLPDAIIGKGPIVRLGDRRTVFDSSGSHVLSTLAQKILPGKHQRRIMDGGSCEGTAATAYGLPVIAMSVPLGNYHNEGFEGGQQCKKIGGPAPEFIHLDDLSGQLKLCHALMRKDLPWSQPWNSVKSRLQKNFKAYKKLL